MSRHVDTSPLDEDQLRQILDWAWHFQTVNQPGRALEQIIAREFYAAGFNEDRFVEWTTRNGLHPSFTTNIRNAIRDIDIGFLQPDQINLLLGPVPRPRRRHRRTR